MEDWKRIKEARVIAVDIDKTLTNEECWTAKECLLATPNWEMIEGIWKIIPDKFIIVSTARVARILAVPTLEWLNKYNVSFNAIDFRKTSCDLIIDDKAITPQDFLRALKTEPYP